MLTTVSGLQKAIHAWAVRKEWRGPNATPRPITADFALFHSEVSETLEAWRDAGDPCLYWETYTVEVQGVKFKDMTLEQLAVLWDISLDDPDWHVEVSNMIAELNLAAKPEGVGPEMADIIIRILDTAEEYGLDMEFEIERKMAHNEQRPVRHGGKHS